MTEEAIENAQDVVNALIAQREVAMSQLAQCQALLAARDRKIKSLEEALKAAQKVETCQT